jgi:cytochrome c-type biogenesis protein CcmH
VKKHILWLILLAAGVAGAWALLATSTTLAGGLAQKATPSDDAVNEIARQLYCPVCENIPLDVCPTQACAQWRALIREKLAQGWTEEQIKTYFVEQYGVRVLNEPPRQGWNWLIYIVPALFLIGGGILLFRLFRSWQTPAPAADVRAPAEQSQETLQSQPPTGADDYLKRFEEEADKRK